MAGALWERLLRAAGAGRPPPRRGEGASGRRAEGRRALRGSVSAAPSALPLPSPGHEYVTPLYFPSSIAEAPARHIVLLGAAAASPAREGDGSAAGGERRAGIGAGVGAATRAATAAAGSLPLVGLRRGAWCRQRCPSPQPRGWVLSGGRLEPGVPRRALGGERCGGAGGRALPSPPPSPEVKWGSRSRSRGGCGTSLGLRPPPPTAVPSPPGAGGVTGAAAAPR